jgi:3,4-dihydroxy 2-butanone 4-phosphate synthase/GTP cyclohydrolase II
MAGLTPAGVICEIMNDDGTMARVPQLAEFCQTHGLKLLTVAEVIRYRMRNERYVRRVAEAALPTRYGEFRMIVYASDVDREQHIALVRGNLTGAPPLVRVHSHCLTGDVFASTDCDCHDIIEHSLEAIVAEDRGVFVYLHHTGRGFGIESAPHAPGALPHILYHSRGQLDQDIARQRQLQHESGIGAQILIDLGLKSLRVLTNHPRKVVALEGYGLTIADQVPVLLSAKKRSHQAF